MTLQNSSFLYQFAELSVGSNIICNDPIKARPIVRFSAARHSVSPKQLAVAQPAAEAEAAEVNDEPEAD